MRRSVWAMPSPRDSARFSEWIERLAAAATGSAIFAPHVTLVGSVPAAVAEDTVGNALRSFAPFEVTLTGLADSDQRTRCITVVVAPDPPLLDLRAALVDACGVDPTPYKPHLSLLYARLPAARRKTLRATVDLVLPTTVEVGGVRLVDTTGDDAARWATKRSWRLAASF